MWQAAASATSDSPAVRELDYEVVNTYPHRSGAFTQGLMFYQGFLWEGTGQHGRSSVAKIRLKDGVVLASQHLPARYFGEGITLFNGRLLQLTWKAQTLFVYDAATLKKLSTLPYRGEGWGLTHNGEQLIVSDGSSSLQFRSAQDFSLESILHVHENSIPSKNLNELEWVEGLVLANVWQSDWIVVIDPSSGAVVAKLDLSALRKEQGRRADVLNGIAWRNDTQTLLVTGKYWRTLYEIRVLPALPKLQ
ncbi:MAG: glutaminyl-peptide cyclotransferase [Pseudomonadales bacterium]